MKLALFFSRGVSLKLWIDKGLFDREKLLYEKHLLEGNVSKVYWITYGSDDLYLSTKMKKENKLHKNIIVLPMPKIFNIPKVGSYLYSLFLPIIYKNILKNCDIYKTNQTDGSWSAVIAKKLYGKKLLYRTGFTMSQLENKLKRFNIFIRKTIEWFEKIAYKNCDKAVVASKHNLDYIIDKYQISNDKIEVIYNFIDRDKFYDYEDVREEKVIFIGRLSDEKNIFNLMESLKDLELPLYIYGSGPLRDEIVKFIDKNRYDVKLMGNVLNSELPKILNSAKYFTLVSKHEGMPKALIEGMACGCICIGTNVSGINEVITGNNGILVDDINAKSIKEGFVKAKVLSKKDIKDMKLSAYKSIEQNFILDNILKKEKQIFLELSDD